MRIAEYGIAFENKMEESVTRDHKMNKTHSAEQLTVQMEDVSLHLLLSPRTTWCAADCRTNVCTLRFCTLPRMQIKWIVCIVPSLFILHKIRFHKRLRFAGK